MNQTRWASWFKPSQLPCNGWIRYSWINTNNSNHTSWMRQIKSNPNILIPTKSPKQIHYNPIRSSPPNMQKVDITISTQSNRNRKQQSDSSLKCKIWKSNASPDQHMTATTRFWLAIDKICHTRNSTTRRLSPHQHNGYMAYNWKNHSTTSYNILTFLFVWLHSNHLGMEYRSYKID